jgi:hypothetical protein
MPTKNCPDGYSKFNGHCYMLRGGYDTWDRYTFDLAASQCRSHDSRTHLASVHNIYESAFLTTLIADTGLLEQIDVFWIGLKETNEGFLWVDQTPVDYTNWAALEPAASPDFSEVGQKAEQFRLTLLRTIVHFHSFQGCSQMHGIRSTDQTGMWSNVNCESWYPYICKAPAIYDSQDPVLPKCDADGFTTFDAYYGSCYHHERTKKKWADADAFCKDKGANLVSIHDIAEQAYVINYFEEEDNWIGLSNIGVSSRRKDVCLSYMYVLQITHLNIFFLQHHNSYAWSDGWPYTYANWNSTQPPTEATSDLCVRFNRAEGKWFTESCESEFNFACKYTTRELPTSRPAATCKALTTFLP